MLKKECFCYNGRRGDHIQFKTDCLGSLQINDSNDALRKNLCICIYLTKLTLELVIFILLQVQTNNSFDNGPLDNAVPVTIICVS